MRRRIRACLKVEQMKSGAGRTLYSGNSIAVDVGLLPNRMLDVHAGFRQRKMMSLMVPHPTRFVAPTPDLRAPETFRATLQLRNTTINVRSTAATVLVLLRDPRYFAALALEHLEEAA
jgi:hypothetical protein